MAEKYLLTLILLGSLSCTLLATRARCRDRFVPELAAGLDGRAYMEKAIYFRDGKNIALREDLEAIIWMQKNIKGSPIILEANGPFYSWASRISIHTGLPTVIGWHWHQRQQRGSADPQEVKKRIEDVRQIYSEADPEKILPLLKKYHVSCVYIGALEKMSYPQKGIEKFRQYEDRYWESVYQKENVSIFKIID